MFPTFTVEFPRLITNSSLVVANSAKKIIAFLETFISKYGLAREGDIRIMIVRSVRLKVGPTGMAFHVILREGQ